MTAAEIFAWVGGVAVVLGGIFMVIGALGMVRMPDVFTRIHAASVGDTLGVSLILLGLVLVYAITVPADSGSLTAGMAAAAEPGLRGATMALHSTVGFGLSAFAGWLVGAALDASGGASSPQGWQAGFAVLAAGVSCGPLVLWWSRSRKQAAAPGT